MTTSTHLELPFLAAGQAQKHVTVNETLRRLDVLVQAAVLDRDLAAPPASPAEGARYIVAAAATGAWSGRTGRIAAWQDGAWAFYTPRSGWMAYVVDEARLVAWNGTAWVAAGGGSVNPVDLVGVQTTADTTNRLAVASPASLFTHEGAGHQLKINKATAGQTGSVLFQTNFSGRAEFGLAGDDDFRVKVSSNGTTWTDAIVINRANGAVTMPNTPSGSGVIRQVKLGSRTTGFTTQSTTPVSAGLSVVITPQSASNQVLVRANLTLGGRLWYTIPEVTIRRNGTKIWPQGSSPSMRHAFISSSDANSNLITFPASIEFIDTPNSTAAQTYEVCLNSTTATYNVHLNIREHDLTPRGESTLSVTEIVP